MIKYIGDYKVEYIEERDKHWVLDYVKIITVYDDEDNIVLCSRDKTEEEFINYLGFLVSEDVIEVATQLLKYGRLEDDDEYDYADEAWWNNRVPID